MVVQLHHSKIEEKTMIKKELIKKLADVRDDAEIQLIDAEGNGYNIVSKVKNGIDPMLEIEQEDESTDFDEEDYFDDEDDIDEEYDE